jgi:hypothetical protein
MSDDADRLSKMTLEELRLELHRVRSKPDSELRRIADLFRVNVNKQLPYEEELLSLIEFHEKQEAQNLRTTELSSMEALVLVDMVHDRDKSSRNELEFLACSLLGLDFTNDQKNALKFAKQRAGRNPEQYAEAEQKVKKRLEASEPINTKFPKSVRMWLEKT